jgi:hypothetical protein
VNASGGLAVAVTRRASGFCIGGSDAAVRSDAWRCTVGDVIADPCFTVDSSHVLCPVGGPWTNTGVELFLPGGLPTALANANQGTRGQPWAVELRTGAKCVRITGVSSIINGQRLNYDCTGGLGLYGNVQRSGPVWMIFVGGLRSGQISLEPITTVWF